ncbi:hypothetical protein ACQQCD_04605 [Pseudarthrobacter sp. J1763]|uniref:hypothetical protein n=1 Tax=Pseudarthrobacter sp. J1763 TaxID=3420445 RepID=UPI003D2BCB39
MNSWTRRAVPVVIAAALVASTTACTDGGFLDQRRMSLFQEGLSSELTKAPYTGAFIDEMAAQGNTALVSVDGGQSDGPVHRALFTADAGKSWKEAKFADSTRAKGSILGLGFGGGKWTVLAEEGTGYRTYQSTNGVSFAPGGEVGLPARGRSILHFGYVGKQWSVVFSPTTGLPGTYLSSDGVHWKASKTAWPNSSGLRVNWIAAGGGQLMAVGNRLNESTKVSLAVSYVSADAGATWKEVPTGALAIAPRNSGFSTVAWNGTGFSAMGWEWQDYRRSDYTPLGLRGEYSTARGWIVAQDASWSDGYLKAFPNTTAMVQAGKSLIALNQRGEGTAEKSEVLLRKPGGTWTNVALPKVGKAGLPVSRSAVPVDGGALANIVYFDQGTVDSRLYFVDANGKIQDRSPKIPGVATEQPVIESIGAANGGSRMFGHVGRQAVVWDSTGDKDFKNFSRLNVTGNIDLKEMVTNDAGDIIYGTDQSKPDVKTVLWSRKPNGQWQSYNADVFGNEQFDEDGAVQDALPLADGFLIAGTYTNPVGGGDATSAGIAFSADGKSWERSKESALSGKTSADRGINSLEMTDSKTVIAGGFIETGSKDAPAVWTSKNHKSWAAVKLPAIKGYSDAEVIDVASGPQGTTALVQSHEAGKKTTYSTFLSKDDGATWQQGTSFEDGPGSSQGYWPLRFAPL